MHLTPARIDQLRAEGILPRDGAMRPTLEAALAYFRDRSDLTAARRENLVKKNALLDTAIATANRTSIPQVEVDEAWTHIVLTIRQKFLGLPSKIAPRIPYLKSEVEIEAEIQKEVEQILTDLARTPEYQPETQHAPRP